MHTAQLYNFITHREILNALASCPLEHDPGERVNRHAKRSKEALIDTLLKEGPYWVKTLDTIATNNYNTTMQKQSEKQARHDERQRDIRREARQLALAGEFLDLPSQDEYLNSYAEFHAATSNAALKQLVCAVCARLLNSIAAGVISMKLVELPNRNRLRPYIHHGAQFQTSGCLLEEKGCSMEGPDPIINVCRECLSDLKKSTSNPPKHSLANNLWVGPMPWQLESLTMTEQLLVALVYPRVFVVKLFPRDKSQSRLPEDQIQHALRGNVTSFELNSEAIAEMINGNLMPQKTAILASVLSITFIGRGRVLTPAALNLFRVRREKVADALKWLKTYNTKYYGHIKIDPARLAELPVDDVPLAVRVNIRHEEDNSMINAEADGYIPSMDEDDPDTAELSRRGSSDAETSMGADVVPLQYLGVMDNDLSKISTNELMKWGLQNMWKSFDDSECGYAVRHGAPVNTFGQPPKGQGPADPNRRNYWEVAFPSLFPHGMGGIESDRPVQLSFTEHTRWLLRYPDHRFRYHHSFIFVAFGIQQRRQALRSARIQMQRRDFESVAQTLSSITPDDLRCAAIEEERGQKPSNPAISTLKAHITATSRRVVGSDPARIQLRSQITSTSMYFNQPTIWMTINPDDLHDPIAQIFAGEDIDMDNFVKTAGPDGLCRSRNIARDPFAAAEFFNFLITLVLEKLFGITSTNSRVHFRTGVLGKLSAYFGTVECQGRGTLHLHMLIWLHNTPPPRRLKELLQTPEFREKVVRYIKSNVRSFLPKLATPVDVQKEPKDAAVAYSRCPDPKLPLKKLLSELDGIEVKVVRTKQMHKCDFGRCLRYDKHGKQVCKRRAPWQLSDHDLVEPDGIYYTKRQLAFLNSYCPVLAVTLKCNQDIKLLLHGRETKHLICYVTKYMAKPEGRTHNVISLLSDSLGYHFDEDPNVKDLKERQRDLIFRSVNVLNREQEVPAPLVVTYLMGWGDVYRSHQYTIIYWGSFVSYIKRIFPDLRAPPPDESSMYHSTHAEESISAEGTWPQTDSLPTEQAHSQQAENTPEEIILHFDNVGKLCKRSQVDDYIYRGEEANTFNLLDYLVGTYEQTMSRQIPDTSVIQNNTDDTNTDRTNNTANRPGARGRPMHQRIKYLRPHPRSETHIRVVRPQEHNCVPNMVGPPFPRRGDPTQANVYAAAVLMLVKPWRDSSDLKRPDQSWSDALNAFLSTAGDRVLDILDNLEHQHESQTAAEAKRSVVDVFEDTDMQSEELFALQDPETDDGPHRLSSLEITQEMVDEARREAEDNRDSAYGKTAVQIGRTIGAFDAAQGPIQAPIERATNVDLDALKNWQTLLEQDLPAAHAKDPNINNGLIDTTDLGDVEPMLPLLIAPDSIQGNVTSEPVHERPIDPITPANLLPEQQRAFGIVQWHLMRTLHVQNFVSSLQVPQQVPQPVPQLFMLLVGEGGTGKSRVIQTITEEFRRQRVVHILVKAAYTGCAASLIEGRTTHQIARISVGNRNKTLSADAKKELANMWQHVQYLIIDEYSMISKEFLAQLSRHISIAKLGSASDDGASSFGGVNVLLCGDLHQFPPVAASSGGALYYSSTSDKFRFSAEAGLGRAIYKKFSMVVVLKQQVRVTDPVWRSFLANVRRGCVKEEDIQLLESLVLTNPKCVPTDFESEKWRECSLITPRNAVRTRWNDAAVRKHCCRTGHQLLICPAFDTCVDKGMRRPINLHEQYVSIKQATNAKNSRKGRGERNGLPDEIPLAIGLKIMVTLNVKTDLDVTNGARGVIVGIKLDPNEPPFEASAPIVILTRPPAYILVKLVRTRANTLPGLSEGVIPITPVSKGYSITMHVVQKDGHVEPVKRTIQRIQFPITPAYAFTDYRSQGQTIPAAIIDIANPPTGQRLNSHNLYVALSRCSGRDNVRILRQFDRDILQKPLDFELMKEDERLEKLDSSTREWWESIYE